MTETRYAASPLERLRWLGQVQGDPEMGDADVSTALMIARFINSKTGFSFQSGKVFARLLRISRRAWVSRLARLERRGHVEVERRGPHAAALRAVVLPDCAPFGDEPSEAKDEKHDFASFRANDGKRGFTSSEIKDENCDFPSLDSKDEKNRCASFPAKDGKFPRKKMRSGQKNSGANSTGSRPITRDIQGITSRVGGNEGCEFGDFPPDFFGPGEGDEIIATDCDADSEPPAFEPAAFDAAPIVVTGGEVSDDKAASRTDDAVRLIREIDAKLGECVLAQVAGYWRDETLEEWQRRAKARDAIGLAGYLAGVDVDEVTVRVFIDSVAASAAKPHS